MSMWSYPVGAIVNMGQPLTERTVRGPLPVTINDISYGPDIFSKWPMADIAALGIKLFIENPIPQDHIGGTPVDIETDEQITRTYPDMQPDTEGIKARRRAAILADLVALDLRRIRPTAEGDAEFLAVLNAQAVALREELAGL